MAALRKSARPKAEEHLGIWPANWPALRVFLGLSTQWHRAGMAGEQVGLDYAAMPVVAGMMGIPADADLLARIRVLEAEALVVIRREAASRVR